LPYVLKGVFEKNSADDAVIQCFIAFNAYWEIIHDKKEYSETDLPIVTTAARKVNVICLQSDHGRLHDLSKQAFGKILYIHGSQVAFWNHFPPCKFDQTRQVICIFLHNNISGHPKNSSTQRWENVQLREVAEPYHWTNKQDSFCEPNCPSGTLSFGCINYA